MPPPITPATLFKIAAFLNAISVPGHIKFGLDTVHPTLSSIKLGDRKKRVGHASATASYNYINGALAILAILNWQWAKTGGPITTAEKSILWISLVNGFIDGFTYFKAGEYAPLAVMWLAPGVSVAAHLLQ